MHNYFLKFKRKRKGFTLLELIVVIVILGLLASLAIPTFKKIINQTQLKVAEVTAASVARETVALAGIDVGLIQESHIKAAVNDLPGGLNEPVVSASDTGVNGYQVVFGKWEFSGHPRTLSVVRGGEPQGASIGVALAVPGVGCAFARNDGNTVKAWSVDRLDIENCNGAVAFIEPEEALKLSPPPTPQGINISFTCSVNGETGWDVTFDNALVDVYINGKYAGTYASGTCIPGSEDDIIVAVPNDSNTGQPGGWENGAGNVLDDEVIETPTEPNPTNPNPGTNVSNPVTSDGKTPNVIIWSPTPGADSTIISRGPVNGPLTPVHAGDDTGSHYDTSPPGDYVYEVQPTKDGEPLGGPIKVEVKPVTKPEALKDDEESLKAEILGDSALIAWGEVPDTLTAPLTGYKIYRSFNGSEVTLLGETLKGTTSYNDGPLNPGMYCYQLTAYGLGGESGKSAPSCAEVIVSNWGNENISGTKLFTSDAKANEASAKTVLVKNDTLLVANPNHRVSSLNTGAVYVFTKKASGWVQEAKLTAPDGAGYSYFGSSVSFDGTTIAIGSEGAKLDGTSIGAVYLFNKNGATWQQTNKIISSDKTPYASFGASVSIEDGTLVVGAPGENASSAVLGKVYIFKKTASTWVESAKLENSEATRNTQYGKKVIVNNGYLMIGESYGGAARAGSIHIFKDNAGKWDKTETLTEGGVSSAEFGKIFSWKNNRLVVGAPNVTSNGLSGIVYIYERSSEGSWSKKQQLQGGVLDKSFGKSVDFNKEVIVIASTVSNDAGQISVYSQKDNTWVKVNTLKADTYYPQDNFGNDVSVTDKEIAVTVPNSSEKGTKAGSVYIFTP